MKFIDSITWWGITLTWLLTVPLLAIPLFGVLGIPIAILGIIIGLRRIGGRYTHAV